jgi:hypothetical protein
MQNRGSEPVCKDGLHLVTIPISSASIASSVVEEGDTSFDNVLMVLVDHVEHFCSASLSSVACGTRMGMSSVSFRECSKVSIWETGARGVGGFGIETGVSESFGI